jgi:two-component system sensor histidine kinase RpfC
MFGLAPIDQELCQSHLRSWGVSCQAYGSVDEAKRAFQEASASQQPFDVVVAGGHSERDLASLGKLLSSQTAPVPVLLGVYEENTQYTVNSLFGCGFAALVPSPIEKTVLFNALHAGHNPERARQVSVAAIAALGWPGAFPSYNVLLADDNATNRTILETALRRAGHSVIAATSGDEALERLAQQRFDLAILDVRMPDVSGIDVLKAWRFQEEAGVRLPILILTADATQEAVREALDAGADAFLAKPVQLSDLIERIHSLARPARRAPKPAEVAEQPVEPTPTASDAPCVRVAVLEELTALSSDRSFFANLVEGFIADTEDALEQMESAIRVKNPQLFRDAAHAIKGSASNLGADHLVELCNQGRVISGQGMSRRHPVLLAEIRVEFARVSEVLRGHAKATAKPGLN